MLLEDSRGFGERYATGLDALAAVQKSSRGVSFYSRHVNRPLGRRVAAAAAALGLEPDHVTAASGLCSLVAVCAVALLDPSAWTGVLAAAALVLGFVLDSADGQLARLTRRGSPRGELLDHLVDCATKLALHAAVLIAFYRSGDAGDLQLLAPLAFQFVAVLLFFEGTLVGKLRESPAVPPRSEASARSRRLTGLVLLPLDYGTLCCAFLLWGWRDAFLVAYVALLAAQLAGLVVFSRRWFRELGEEPA